MNGERYLIDTFNKVVHDLYNLRAECDINRIIQQDHDLPCATLSDDASSEVDLCQHCF